LKSGEVAVNLVKEKPDSELQWLRLMTLIGCTDQVCQVLSVLLVADSWHGLDWPRMAVVLQGAADPVDECTRQHDVSQGSKVSRPAIFCYLQIVNE